MTLAQLIRRNGGNGYRVSTTKTTNKGRWGIKIFNGEDEPIEEVTIFTVANLAKKEIKQSMNVVKTHPHDENGKPIKDEVVWIATNKKGIDYGDFVESK